MSEHGKKRNKNGLLTLDSDCDFSELFSEDEAISSAKSTQKKQSENQKQNRNRHGIKILSEKNGPAETESHSDFDEFEVLLEQSFCKKRPSRRLHPKPMPVKKRIKRYPPVQKQLDLHGCTAAKAVVLARSFIQNHKHQGFFTIRIIVGRGRHSKMGPILPDVIEDLVTDLKKQGLVLWFEWEQKNKARSGALIVYLKQFEQFD